MASFSPVPSYAIGAACIALGLHCFLLPDWEPRRFGLPLEQRGASPRADQGSSPSTRDAVESLIYLKGIRELTYGIALIALQYQGYDAAVTTFGGVLSLAGLGDGLLVWFRGGQELRYKALGHWAAFVGLASWSLWRGMW